MLILWKDYKKTVLYFTEIAQWTERGIWLSLRLVESLLFRSEYALHNFVFIIIIILSEAAWLQKHIEERSSLTCRTSECKNLIIKMF